MFLTKLAGGFVLLFFYFFRAKGLKNIPSSGPAIIAPNHVSYFDPPATAFAVKRRVYFFAWRGLYTNPLIAWYLKSLGAIPVAGGHEFDRHTYRLMKTLLEHGEVICIYPEGQRGDGSEILPLLNGVGRLALQSGAPIIPAYISGTLRAFPRWRRFPKLFIPFRVRYFKPIRVTGRWEGSAVERRNRLNTLMQRLRRRLVKAHKRDLLRDSKGPQEIEKT